jgi:hypothetical protein
VQAECIAIGAVAVKLFLPFHHVCLAAVFLDEPADAIAAFAGALGAFDAEHVELALDVTEDEISPPTHDRDITIELAVGTGVPPSFQWSFLMAKNTEGRRKLVEFDAETWHALNLLSREAMKTFQELADEAFRDLLQKYGRPTDLKAALRESAKGAVSGRRRPRLWPTPIFRSDFTPPVGAAITGNELSYASAKATEAAAPEAAEASTAAPPARRHALFS